MEIRVTLKTRNDEKDQMNSITLSYPSLHMVSLITMSAHTEWFERSNIYPPVSQPPPRTHSRWGATFTLFHNMTELCSHHDLLWFQVSTATIITLSVNSHRYPNRRAYTIYIDQRMPRMNNLPAKFIARAYIWSLRNVFTFTDFPHLSSCKSAFKQRSCLFCAQNCIQFTSCPTWNV